MKVLCCLLALFLVGAFAQDYSKPGSFAYKTTSSISYTFPTSTDCSRSECDTKIQVTYPTASGSFPLVIYNNGFSQDLKDYLSYAEYYASWGYVTVRWNPKEGALGSITHKTRGLQAAHLIDWAFSETKNPSSPFYNKIDSTKGVIQAGHSLGGKTALMAAQSHPSVVGLVLMDPVDCPPPMPPNLPYDEDYPAAILEMNNTKAVGVFIGAELGDTGELIPCAPVDCNYQKYYGNATSPAWEVMVVGAGHVQWVDGTRSGGGGGCLPGPQKTEIVQMLSHTIMVAWAENLIYRKDISYWQKEWAQEMTSLNYMTSRIK